MWFNQWVYNLNKSSNVWKSWKSIYKNIQRSAHKIFKKELTYMFIYENAKEIWIWIYEYQFSSVTQSHYAINYSS